MKRLIQGIVDYGLIISLIIFPVSINIALVSPRDPIHPLLALNLSIADLLIGLLLFLWGLKIVIFKELREIIFPPKPVLVLVLIVILSFVNASSLVNWGKDTIQFIEYLIFYYILLLNNLNTLNTKAYLILIYALSSVVLIIGFIQWLDFSVDPYLIRGVFENRNILGMYLCMITPILFTGFLSQKKLVSKLAIVILLILITIVITSGSAIFSILISLIIISKIYSNKLLLRLSGIFLVITICYPIVMPRNNVESIEDFLTIFEKGSVSDNYYRRLSLLNGKVSNVLLQKKVGENNLRVSITDMFSTKSSEIPKGNAYEEFENTLQVKNRYLEMQAALNVISDNTLLGYGMGNYNTHLGDGFRIFPKINTGEPNQHNTYLLVTLSTGILGLTVLVWLLVFYIRRTYYLYKANQNDKRLFYLGLMASIIACSIEAFFSNLFVAGLFVPLIFILFLSSKDQIKYENN